MPESSIEPTPSPSNSSLQPSSAPLSPWLSLASLVSSTGLSVYVIHSIIKAWLAGLIPDGRYALAGIVLAVLPAGILGQVATAIAKRLTPGGSK
jgi:hypothetical protein